MATTPIPLSSLAFTAATPAIQQLAACRIRCTFFVEILMPGMYLFARRYVARHSTGRLVTHVAEREAAKRILTIPWTMMIIRLYAYMYVRAVPNEN